MLNIKYYFGFVLFLGLSACGSEQQDKKSSSNNSDSTAIALESLTVDHADILENGKNCSEKNDGEACKWLGDYYLEAGQEFISYGGEAKDAVYQRVKRFYDKGCEANHQPSCDAAKKIP